MIKTKDGSSAGEEQGQTEVSGLLGSLESLWFAAGRGGLDAAGLKGDDIDFEDGLLNRKPYQGLDGVEMTAEELREAAARGSGARRERWQRKGEVAKVESDEASRGRDRR